MTSLFAKLFLAWTFVLHILRKIFTRGGRGVEQFLENYRGDRLFPLTSSDKDWLLEFSKCFNCGLCDAACPALEQYPREKFPGPSYLVTTFTRTATDFWAVDLDFSMCQACSRCQQVCPNQVPVKEALEFIEAKAREFVTQNGVNRHAASSQSLF